MTVHACKIMSLYAAIIICATLVNIQMDTKASRLCSIQVCTELSQCQRWVGHGLFSVMSSTVSDQK